MASLVKSVLAIGVAVIVLPSANARAQAVQASATSETPATDLWSRDQLLGDMDGLRAVLGKAGITFSLQETSEVLGNVTGGVRTGMAYDGVTQMSLLLDTTKASWWDDGSFYISSLQIHGRNLSAEKLLTLQTASGYEASRATRLWEVWYQQGFLNGVADMKLGQQSLDQEFIVSQYSSLYINTIMGWPMVPSADLYAGGPAYPLSSLGARLRAHPTEALTVLTGVFDDNPPGGPFADDSQLRGAEAAGAKFNLNTGAFFIAEMQYGVNQPAPGTRDAPAQGLPATYKLGAWFDSGAFPDQRFDNTGLSLANPASTGQPRMHRDNYSLYGLIDQMIWRPDPQQQKSVAVFARMMGAPADRNLIDFSVDAGVNLKAPLPGRDGDTFGVGYGFARVSGRASDLDRDTAFFSGSPQPIRSGEHFVEVTYQYQVAPWWQLQPDFQYVFNPGGGILNPANPKTRISDEAVFGLRTLIIF